MPKFNICCNPCLPGMPRNLTFLLGPPHQSSRLSPRAKVLANRPERKGSRTRGGRLFRRNFWLWAASESPNVETLCALISRCRNAVCQSTISGVRKASIYAQCPDATKITQPRNAPLAGRGSDYLQKENLIRNHLQSIPANPSVCKVICLLRFAVGLAFCYKKTESSLLSCVQAVPPLVQPLSNLG